MVSVGRGRFAVAADAVERIVDPASEPGFAVDAGGTSVTYRGGRHAVVDLHGTLGEPRAAAPIYLLLADGRAVVAVDAAMAIRDVPPAEIAPLPPFIFADGRRVVRGIFSEGGEPRLLLDERGLA